MISILSTTVQADRHVHKTMKYEAEQKYKIGNNFKSNVHYRNYEDELG